MRTKIFALLSAAAFGLSGCGDSAATQSLIGAGFGASAASILDQDPIVGAFVGAATNVAYCNRNPQRC